jgi:YD repeat-containing protein
VNADGQRVGKTDTGGTVNYVWDGENVLIETDASNAIEAVYTRSSRSTRQPGFAATLGGGVVLPI